MDDFVIDMMNETSHAHQTPEQAVHIDASIAVYRGDPVDLREYRHTGICFSFSDDSPPMMYISLHLIVI